MVFYVEIAISFASKIVGILFNFISDVLEVKFSVIYLNGYPIHILNSDQNQYKQNFTKTFSEM